MKFKEERTGNNKILHFAVGAVIERNGKYLLVDRKNPPYGFAGLAGHVDEGENSEEALKREVKEESGLEITNYKLLFEEELDWNTDSKGVPNHHWRLYECETEGDVVMDKEEEKSIEWYTKEEIQKLTLEPVWEYWFKKLNIIKQ